MSGYAQQAQGVDRREGEVQRELRALREYVEHLDSATTELEQRLGTVLRQRDPELVRRDEEKALPVSSPLAIDLHSIGDLLGVVGSRVRGVLDRLEL